VQLRHRRSTQAGLTKQAMLCRDRAYERCRALLSAAGMRLFAMSVVTPVPSLVHRNRLPQPSSLGPRRPAGAAGACAGLPRGRRRGGRQDRGHAAAHRARARARSLARVAAGAGRLRGGGRAGRARRGGRRGHGPGIRAGPRADRGGAHAAAGCAQPSRGVPDGRGCGAWGACHVCRPGWARARPWVRPCVRRVGRARRAARTG